LSGGNLLLSWPTGSLQEADVVTGPYTDVATGGSHTVPASAAKKFYRVRFQ
jgi:hypothetical protein